MPQERAPILLAALRLLKEPRRVSLEQREVDYGSVGSAPSTGSRPAPTVVTQRLVDFANDRPCFIHYPLIVGISHSVQGAEHVAPLTGIAMDFSARLELRERLPSASMPRFSDEQRVRLQLALNR